VEALLGAGNGELDLFGFFTPLPRRPVETAEAVQDGAPDLMLSIGLQLDILSGVVLVHSRDQPDNSCRHQILKTNVFGQAAVDASSNQPDLGQMLEDQPFSFIGTRLDGIRAAIRVRHDASNNSFHAAKRPVRKGSDPNRFRTRALVAGSISSGISCPVPKNEIGLPWRTDREKAVPKEPVSSKRVNTRLEGRKISNRYATWIRSADLVEAVNTRCVIRPGRVDKKRARSCARSMSRGPNPGVSIKMSRFP